LEFQILSPDQYPEWDNFVDVSPQGTLFSKSFYLNAVGMPYRIGAVFKGDQIQGGIVLAKNELRAYSNPMFVKYLGVLLRPMRGKYVRRLSTENKIIELIAHQMKRYKSFDYSFHPSFLNWLPFYWNRYRQETRYTYRFENLDDMENIYKEMDSVVRNDMRKAEKHEIQIKNNIDIDLFYNINQLTYRRQGGRIPYSFSFLKRYCDCMKQFDAVRLMGAFDAKGNVHAVCGIVYDRRCCYFILNGINHNLPGVGANTLLVVAAIKTAATLSHAFDFEGSMLRPVEHFYRKFGAKLTPYHNIWKDNLSNELRRRSIRIVKRFKYGK
jgi:hypothetical protein